MAVQESSPTISVFTFGAFGESDLLSLNQSTARDTKSI